MFFSKTPKIEKIKNIFTKRIKNLEDDIFFGKTNIYIDYANVRNWYEKLDWHVDIKRLKQFLNSFTNIQSIKFYQGTLVGDEKSENEIRQIKRLGFELKTKDVKIMKHSINVKRIESMTSEVILKKFIKSSLLRKYDLDTVEYLNRKFEIMNKLGEYFIEDRKCNFDVEIGRDMLLDYEKNNIDTFILWSCDSDFYDPLLQLLKDDKKVILFATSGKVAWELNSLQEKGLFIFDIQKIKNFICYNRDIDEKVKKVL